MTGGIFISQEFPDVAVLAANRKVVGEIEASILDFVAACSDREIVGILRTQIPTIKVVWKKPSSLGPSDYCLPEKYEPVVRVVISAISANVPWEILLHRYDDGSGWYGGVMEGSVSELQTGRGGIGQGKDIRRMVFDGLKHALALDLDGCLTSMREREREIENEHHQAMQL